MKTKTKWLALPVMGATLAFILLAGSASASAANYFNGFETDIAGWETPTRVPSGTDGITSSTGGFHATTAGDALGGAGDSTRWGGYNYGAGNAVPTVFHEYSTSVDIYLNVEGGWANNTRFDFDSAINNSAGTFLSDFIFNAGFYNDGTGPGAGTDRFVVSASYNSQPTSAYPKNPGLDPIDISTTGWYTFQHHFYDNAGVLNVDMSIFDASGALIHTWTLVSAPITGVGGNRYGWFDFNEFSTLAFDNTMMVLLPLPHQIKIQVGNEIIALLATITDGGDRSKLQDAINHLNKSIAVANWVDDSHPTPGSKGEAVFNEEEKTVNDLKALRNNNHSGILAATLQDYIDRLVGADRQIAEIAIAEAIANPPYNAGKISTANSELSKGDVEAARDHPDKAIDHYKNAWKNAIAAG
jgi:hypothetical protein